MSGPGLAMAVLVIGLPAYFGTLACVLSWIRADAARRIRDEERHRRRRKPGPKARELEREAIRLRGLALARDVAAGRVAPLGPRVTRQQIKAERA